MRCLSSCPLYPLSSCFLSTPTRGGESLLKHTPPDDLLYRNIITSFLNIFVHLSPVLVDPVQVEHGEALVAGGGAAGGRQGQRAALLQLLQGE